MATPIVCDLGCDNLAVLLVTNVTNGDTLGICPDHVPVWADDLAAQFRPSPLPHGGDEDGDDEGDDEGEGVAPRHPRPRPRRPRVVRPDPMALDRQGGGPQLETQAGDQAAEV